MAVADTARRYLAVVQAAEGYPAPGEPLEAAPPDGPAPPILHSVVLADDYEELQRTAKGLRHALAGMVDLYRHPDTGGTDTGAKAFIAAKAALGEGGEP